MLWKPSTQACFQGTTLCRSCAALQAPTAAYPHLPCLTPGDLFKCKVSAYFPLHTLEHKHYLLPSFAFSPGALLIPHSNKHRFTSKGIQIHEQIHRDTTGKIVRATENLDQAIDVLEQKYKKRPVVIGWHECRQLLFEELPPETVEFDKQVCQHTIA